jgi:hypothetical protein
MSRQQISIKDKPINREAAMLAREYTKKFAETLIIYARTIADQNGHEIVVTSDISDALETMHQKTKRRRWKQLAAVLGSAFLGLSLSVSYNDLMGLTSNPPTGHAMIVIVSVVVALVSLLVTTVAMLHD